jgi:hypothetical protein
VLVVAFTAPIWFVLDPKVPTIGRQRRPLPVVPIEF